MARTVSRWTRVYMGGYPVHCYTQSIGPLSVTYPEIDATTLCDNVRGYLPGMPEITPGTLNGVLENGTNTLHAIATAAGLGWPMSVQLGFQAEPALGDPAFCGYFLQTAYQAADSSGLVTVNVPFSGYKIGSGQAISKAWGNVVAPYAEYTGANSTLYIDNGAATTAGGYMVYHVSGADGDGTITIQDSADNVTYAAVTGLTSGLVDATLTPQGGLVSTSATATIRRYVRFQLALGSANSMTFTVSFVRG